MTQRLLGAYAARRCAVRTQWDVLRPVKKLPMSELGERITQEGLAFERDVIDALLAVDELADIVDVTADWRDRELRTAETLTALQAGATIIAGGRLPDDIEGRRVAEPDLLVRVGDGPIDGRWRYLVADVKRHKMLVESGGISVVVDELSTLGQPDAPGPNDDRVEPRGQRGAKVRNDLLQLAHYHRTLEATGHATTGPAWAAVLSKEEVAVWYRLDLPMWQGEDHSSHEDDRVSTLELYDAQFAHRLAIADVATAHADDPAVALLVKPVRISECDTCPWTAYCGALIEAADHPSLLPRLGARSTRLLAAADVDTIAGLAALDDDETVEGIENGVLIALMDEARARTGPDPVYARRGRRFAGPLRADVEVDVDMENLDEVYLWGVLVTDRAGTALAPEGYRAFADWRADLTEEHATVLFLEFWRWLQGLREACAAAGHSFAAYCWSGPVAEDKWLRSYGALAGITEEVEAFIAAPDWVDLEQPFRHEVVTGHRTGLKTVARLAGFDWRDDDPGGGQSTVWYDRATDESVPNDERAALVERLLIYNEDDVLATLAVREWLDAAGKLDPPPQGRNDG